MNFINVWDSPIDLKIDNLGRVSISTKIVATFDAEHLIHGTTYGVGTTSAFEILCLYLSNVHCVEVVNNQIYRFGFIIWDHKWSP